MADLPDNFVTLDALVPMLKALREQGVSEFAARPDGGWCVKFQVPAAPPQQPVRAPTAEDVATLREVLEPESCDCGHPEFAHSNGLCIHGCSPEKCAPAEDQPADEDQP